MRPCVCAALAALLLMACVLQPTEAGMHKGAHEMPKESREFHRLVEEPEEHPHLKHFFDWKKKYAAVGGEAKAFRGKVPEDLMHYLVNNPHEPLQQVVKRSDPREAEPKPARK